jgi:hypothetical protein
MDPLEAKLVKEAETAKSQWKLPSLGSIINAIFFSDHYSWMWAPSR